MVPQSSTAVRRRIGEVLVEQGVVSEGQLALALRTQREVQPGVHRQRLGAVVLRMGMATSGRSRQRWPPP